MSASSTHVLTSVVGVANFGVSFESQLVHAGLSEAAAVIVLLSQPGSMKSPFCAMGCASGILLHTVMYQLTMHVLV